MRTFCQIILIVNAVVTLLGYIYHDINGRTAIEPLGFKGVLGSLLAFVVNIALLYGAGALSSLNGGAR